MTLIPPQKDMASLAAVIDHTLLRPDAGSADVLRICEEARREGFAAVCVYPARVREARRHLGNSGVAVCTVAGFPHGASTTEGKLAEAETALRHGAGEIDMVLNRGLLADGNDGAVTADIRRVASCCREHNAVCKVIIESASLDAAGIRRACACAVSAGADFVKTSTGFETGGATTEAVRIMAAAVAPAGLRIKAAGGISTLQQALAMIRAGADRIGTSSAMAIMEELRRAGINGKTGLLKIQR